MRSLSVPFMQNIAKFKVICNNKNTKSMQTRLIRNKVCVVLKKKKKPAFIKVCQKKEK